MCFIVFKKLIMGTIGILTSNYDYDILYPDIDMKEMDIL